MDQNDMNSENQVNNEIDRKINQSRISGGVFLLLIGVLLLAYKMGAPIPGWVFTWPVLLIAIGLFIGRKNTIPACASEQGDCKGIGTNGKEIILIRLLLLMRPANLLNRKISVQNTTNNILM